MLYALPSSDVDLVKPVIACLVAVYATENGRGACAEIDPLLIIRPPIGVCVFIRRMASCVHRNDAVKFVSTTVCHCSNVKSSIGTGGAPVPALLNSTSRRPNASLVLANIAAMALGSDTSATTANPRSPSAPASAIDSASASSRRPTSTTEYPTFKSATAEARPIPELAPVTNATLFDAFI